MRTFKKVLVTGGAGFIGSHLVRLLSNTTDWEITVLDALTYAGNLENIKDCRHQFVKLDIRDKSSLEKYFNGNRFDCFIHLAAESHVDRSIEDGSIFVETNVNGTYNLLEAALHNHRYNMKEGRPFIFYHVSTDEVFGSLSLETSKKFSETTPYDPRSPYSASKAASDHFVRAYHQTYGLPILISNCSNNYGTHQYPEKLIPVVIDRLMKREKIPMYGTGDNMRDWLHVEDHARAIKLILEKGKVGETYCVGSKDVLSNLDLVNTICDIYDRLQKTVKSRSLIEFVKDRAGHDKKYAINFSKLKTQLGWKPTVLLDKGLEETIQWYIDKNKK